MKNNHDNQERVFFENRNVKLWIEDDILHGVYKENSILTLEAAKEIVELRHKFQDYKDYNVIGYVSYISFFTPDARRYFAKEGYKGIKKMAIVTNQTNVKIAMANIYIRIDKPIKPTKLFNNAGEAIRWLKES